MGLRRVQQESIFESRPPAITVKKGQTKTVTVKDGKTGAPAPGAVIDEVTTDANGKAILTFLKRGVFSYKATRDDAIRSNALVVVVG